MTTIRNILEEIGLPEIREELGYLLGKTIPEETKEIKDAKNKIYIKIENTFSGSDQEMEEEFQFSEDFEKNIQLLLPYSDRAIQLIFEKNL